MGYPPRKKNDTSIGDAINWEWIIHVCKEHNANAIIVSRDGDYGVLYNEKSYINDWLSTEFKERVNMRRSVMLHDSLSSALKDLRVRVSKAEEDEERRMIERRERMQRKKLTSGMSSGAADLLQALYGDSWKNDVSLDELKVWFSIGETDD
jgi:RNA polymerase-interacting CarD/CdnL/TRCF family regulator